MVSADQVSAGSEQVSSGAQALSQGTTEQASSVEEQPAPYLSQPFRMKGNKWVGVVLDASTEPEVVFRLFDHAVYASEERGHTIVLETALTTPAVVYQDTAMPVAGTQPAAAMPDVPEKIGQMMRLYEHRDGSLAQKCRNFYRQGKFMEDYEDDAPWNGAFLRYFHTYHDLNLPQLRGYFTWRTHVRKGDFLPIATSLAYIYIYELLNGIGTTSPEDMLEKLQAFEVGFLDSGVGDQRMRGNLHRWMLEYAVLHDVPPEIARQYAKPAMLQRDDALAVLREPKAAGEEAVFAALCAFGCSTFRPSMSQRYCCGVRSLASVSLRGHWKLPDSRRLYSSRNPSPSQYRTFILSRRRPQNRNSVLVNGSS